MAASSGEIGLPELMTKLRDHHDLLERHCEWAERFVMEDNLREDIEKLNASYELLKWWREFRNQLERIKGHFSACSAEATRIYDTGEHTLDAVGRRTIRNSLEQCQQPLNNLALRIRDCVEYEWKSSDDKHEGGDSIQETSPSLYDFAIICGRVAYFEGALSESDDLVGDLQNHHRSVRENAKKRNLGDLADNIGEFRQKLDTLFSHVDSYIEQFAEDIGRIAGRLWQEAYRMAREERDGYEL